jgi:hypothetical protein
MRPLHFRCPTTNGSISTGINTNVESLASAWRSTIHIKCPQCGGLHAIKVREAFVEDAISSSILDGNSALVGS